MREVKKNGNVIYVKNLGYLDLVYATDNASPRCDECNCSLVGRNDIMLIPVLNRATCPRCGKALLQGIGTRLNDTELRVQGNVFKMYRNLLGL